jgi:hypothetical protein
MGEVDEFFLDIGRLVEVFGTCREVWMKIRRDSVLVAKCLMSLLVMSMHARGSSQMGADLICDGMGEVNKCFFDIGSQMEAYRTH